MRTTSEDRKVVVARYSTLILTTYTAYLILGNIPRPGNVFASGGLPVTELLVYVVTLPYFLLHHPYTPAEFVLASGLFLVSAAVGYLIHGPVSLVPGLYALRVGLQLVSSSVIANILNRTLSGSIDQIVTFYVRIFLVNALVGWVLFFTFPEATQLWHLMARLGLSVSGDPHVRRVLGSLLDPNFFGNLLVLGLGLMAALALRDGLKRSAWLGLAVVALTLLHTMSRSSWLGMAVWVATFATLRAVHARGSLKRLARWALTLAAMVSAAIIAFPGASAAAYQRLATVFSDPSAAHRIGSFYEAIRYFLSMPVILTGTGYNFLPFVKDTEYVITAFDSSLATLIVCLGGPLGLATLLLAGSWSLRTYRNIRRVDPFFADSVVAYLAAATVMSFFNNLLLYAPFLLTFLPLAEAMAQTRKKLPECTAPASEL